MNGQRLLDLAVAIVLLPALLLSAPILGIAGRRAGHSSLLFRQDRVGRGGRTLGIRKFRTLPDGRETCTSRFFHIVRSLGLDELPQILLLARGTMACVGPRPLLPRDLLPPDVPADANVREAIRIRQSVKPGLTGVSQTLERHRGRRGDAYWRMLEADVWYATHRSLALDLLVLLFTPLYLVSGGRLRFPRRLIAGEPRRAAPDARSLRYP